MSERMWEFESPRGHFSCAGRDPAVRATAGRPFSPRKSFDTGPRGVRMEVVKPAPRRPCRDALASVGADLSARRSTRRNPTVLIFGCSSSRGRSKSESVRALCPAGGFPSARSCPRNSGRQWDEGRGIDFEEMGDHDRVARAGAGGDGCAGAVRTVGRAQEPSVSGHPALDHARSSPAGGSRGELAVLGPIASGRCWHVHAPLARIPALHTTGKSAILVSDHPGGDSRGRLDHHATLDLERYGAGNYSLRLAILPFAEGIETFWDGEAPSKRLIAAGSGGASPSRGRRRFSPQQGSNGTIALSRGAFSRHTQP